jgi:tmRNA-binding protein
MNENEINKLKRTVKRQNVIIVVLTIYVIISIIIQIYN